MILADPGLRTREDLRRTWGCLCLGRWSETLARYVGVPGLRCAGETRLIPEGAGRGDLGFFWNFFHIEVGII